MDKKEKTCKNCELFKLYETRPTERTESIETKGNSFKKRREASKTRKASIFDGERTLTYVTLKKRSSTQQRAAYMRFKLQSYPLLSSRCPSPDRCPCSCNRGTPWRKPWFCRFFCSCGNRICPRL